jgi:hypothetical protein
LNGIYANGDTRLLRDLGKRVISSKLFDMTGSYLPACDICGSGRNLVGIRDQETEHGY